MVRIVRFDGETIPQEAIEAGYEARVTLDLPYEIDRQRRAQGLTPHDPIIVLRKGTNLLITDDGSMHEVDDAVADVVAAHMEGTPE